MLSKITSYALVGLDGVPVEVETDINKGVVAFDIVGLPDTAVKESKERVFSAIRNSAFKFPVNKITVNLAPADIKKEGSQYDLPIAISLLVASEQLLAKTDGVVMLGELALDGTLRAVTGILPVLISAKSRGFKRFIVPFANANEASYIEGIEVYALKSLGEAIAFLQYASGANGNSANGNNANGGAKGNGAKENNKNGNNINGNGANSGANAEGGAEVTFTPVPTRSFEAAQSKAVYSTDMRYVRGQTIAKRAMEIAVAGGHNILMSGPPGAGKTMLARCLPTIMPDMTFDEALEVTKILSVSGELGEEGIATLRPFRTPHHTATTVSLCGGGTNKIRAGEISKAHRGVLFMDELPEYSRGALEALRQPLEDGKITVTRAGGAVTFPADFILCASMNPCPCGNLGSKERSCTCTPAQIRRYRSKISGPLLDRIDLQVEVDAVKYDELASGQEGEPSAEVKGRVELARAIQRERFRGEEGVTVNADMGEKQIQSYCALTPDCEKILRTAFERLHLSARARSRIIKVARTIADLDASQNICPKHILEATSYRNFDSTQES